MRRDVGACPACGTESPEYNGEQCGACGWVAESARDLPSGEVARITPNGDAWQVTYWGSRADYDADVTAGHGGAWWDRATVSVVVDTYADALAEIGADA